MQKGPRSGRCEKSIVNIHSQKDEVRSPVRTSVIKEGRCNERVGDRRLRICLGEESHRGGRFEKIALLKQKGAFSFQLEVAKVQLSWVIPNMGSYDTSHLHLAA